MVGKGVKIVSVVLAGAAGYYVYDTQYNNKAILARQEPSHIISATKDTVSSSKESLDEKLERAKREIDGRYNEVRKTADSAYDEARNKVDAKYGEARKAFDSKYSELRDNAHQAADEASKQAEKRFEEVREKVDKGIADAEKQSQGYISWIKGWFGGK